MSLVVPIPENPNINHELVNKPIPEKTQYNDKIIKPCKKIKRLNRLEKGKKNDHKHLIKSKVDAFCSFNYLDNQTYITDRIDKSSSNNKIDESLNKKNFLYLYNLYKEDNSKIYSEFLFSDNTSTFSINKENKKLILEKIYYFLQIELRKNNDFSRLDLAERILERSVFLKNEKFALNDCSIYKNDNFKHDCDLSVLKEITEIENYTKKLYYDRYKSHKCDIPTFNQNQIVYIQDFFRTDEILNDLILTNFNEYMFQQKLNWNTTLENEYDYTYIKNLKIRNFIFFVNFDLKKIICKIIRCFKHFDFSFDIIYHIIFETYIDGNTNSYVNDITLQDYYDFLRDIIDSFDEKVYFYQPGIKFFIDYVINSNINYSETVVCTKILFFGINFCYIMNSMIEDESVISFLIKELNRSNFQQKTIKTSIINFVGFDFVFSKMFLYCINPFLTKSRSTDFIQQYVLFYLESLRIININYNKLLF